MLLLGICACCYRHPRGRGGDQMLHARQGSELADLQQAHSKRSAWRLQRACCILAWLWQCRELQLNQMLLTVREAGFKEWGGGYGLAGTWLCSHAAAPAAAGALGVRVASCGWLLARLRWMLGFAEGFLGRYTANARGVCVNCFRELQSIILVTRGMGSGQPSVFTCTGAYLVGWEFTVASTRQG